VTNELDDRATMALFWSSRSPFVRKVMMVAHEAGVTDRIAIGHIAIGCALAYADFRFDAEQWRNHRPALAAWHAEFSSRPSAKATAFADDY
jgi:glutathione S-transferase